MPKNPAQNEAFSAEAELILKLYDEYIRLEECLKNAINFDASNYAYDMESLEFQEADTALKTFIFNNKSFFSPDDMRLLIEVKLRKSKPDRQLNCKVFDAKQHDELKKFIENLLENQLTLRNQRFQILFQVESSILHWSAADILVTDQGLNIIHLDSIVREDPAKILNLTKPNFKTLEKTIRQIRTDSSTKISLIECYTTEMILTDRFHCTYFAMEAALTMSKIKDLHQLVNAKAEKVTEESGKKPSDDNFDRFAINLLELPATLLKNVMSNNLIAAYEQKHGQDEYNKILVRNNSQTKTLRQYTADRTFEVGTAKDAEILRMRNLGIWFTSYHYQQIVKQEKEKREKQTEKDEPINNRRNK